MAGGEHHPGGVQRPGGEVQLVGGDQPQHLRVGAAVGGPAREGRGELGGGRAHVPAHQDVLAGQAEHVDECGANGLDRLGGNGGPDDAAHVVGLEGLRKIDFHTHSIELIPWARRGEDLAQ